MNEADR